MGCDISVFVETKCVAGWFKGVAGWFLENYDPWPLKRCYPLFALLGGARNYEDRAPVAAERGIPPDCEPDTVRNIEGSPAHFGFSWCTIDEYKLVLERYRNEGPSPGAWRPPPGWAALETYLSELALEYGPENVRLIFGFDN
jgi:hypothetical protein